MLNCQLTKAERLNSRLAIERLFAGGNASMAMFPLRLVYRREAMTDADKMDEKPPVSILVSVPKKRFRHAVDRNRMKRLVREAYRLNKHILWKALEGKNERLMLAFVCMTDTLPSYQMVNKSMKKALIRVSEKLS
ncbi:MAG: ribonuclease P protein component [Bacteroidaceae bacterium]|nr:ribonuclease P protein component [Bacteroidaceae bacterium]